jgi:hypothetical protein
MITSFALFVMVNQKSEYYTSNKCEFNNGGINILVLVFFETQKGGFDLSHTKKECCVQNLLAQLTLGIYHFHCIHNLMS